MTEDKPNKAMQMRESERRELKPVEGVEEYIPSVVYTKDSQPDYSRMSPGNLRLAQGLTAEVSERRAQIGQFLLESHLPVDEVILVPLAAQLIRRYRPDPKGPVQCKAPTGTWGFGDPGGDCSECPLSKWRPKNPATGKSTPPPCKESISVRFYSVTHGIPVDFVFSSRAMGQGNFLMQQGMMHGFGGFAVKMESVKTDNSYGSWYMPKVTKLPEIPEEHRDAIEKIMAAMEAHMPNTSAEVLREYGASE